MDADDGARDQGQERAAEGNRGQAVTDAELQGIALQALNIAKTEFEHTGSFGGLLASYHHGSGLHRMTEVEAMIRERLGHDWLDNGHKKDAAFSVLRWICRVAPPEAMVFATAINAFLPTEKLIQMGPEAIRKVLNEGHKRHHQAVQEGLLSLQDAFLAVAQTAERICFYTQTCERGRFLGQPDVHFVDQDQFDGRLKMFGTKGEALRNFASKSGK
jgi:hypothetical protein